MLYKERCWCVRQAYSTEKLARDLTEHTWTLCTGFELEGYLFLNDSTSEDGAQEYAVVKKPIRPGDPYVQVESITFGWCSYDEALAYIEDAIAGTYDGFDFAREVQPKVQNTHEHGTCANCA